MDLNFLSFADGSIHFRRSGKRIKYQAKNSKIFDSIQVYNLSTLKLRFPKFFSQHGKFIAEEPRAFGRWIWKPYLCLEYAKTSGDFLYLDAGSHLNLDSVPTKQRLREYIQMLDESPVLSFQIRKNQFSESLDGVEKLFSRPELLKYCNANKHIEDSNQIESNVIFFRAGQKSRDFFSQIIEIATFNDYLFMRGVCADLSDHNNLDLYRYDQSIYSLLYKKWNFKLIQNETWFHPDWQSTGSNFPIWTVRNRTGVDIFKFRFRDIPERFEIRYRIWFRLRKSMLRLSKYFRII